MDDTSGHASTLRPFISFYGSKWRLAPKYPDPRERLVVEPFAGSAGYSVRRPEYQVKLYDVDERIIGTWQYLIAADADEIRRLPLLKPGQSVTDLPVHQEAKWLIGWWLNKATSYPRNTMSAWARESHYARQFWGPVIRERIASQVAAIRHWTAEVSSYADVPDQRATWFVDPPYIGQPGSYYTYSNAGINFDALADWCWSRSGHVMVCENQGADWLPFKPFSSAKGTSGKVRTGISHEVLWERE